MTPELIAKFLRLRSKNMPIGSMINFKHFTQTQIDELKKMFPQKNLSDWKEFRVK